jgi:hypothetical protein
LDPNQLPSFIQYLLVDFNIAALNGAADAMKGGNVSTARSVVPAFDNYPAVAQQLRMGARTAVQDWIPLPPASPYQEPPTRPYSAGAGQYPTVGRAALFSAILSNNYGQTIGNDIRNALRELGNSLGDLNAYCGGNASESIAVYVGFSLSGGTGAGLFLDVLQFLIHELHTQLRGNKATIIPIVYLPSAFEGVLPPRLQKRAQLNCAQGILDLHGLVASRQRFSSKLREKYTLEYPNGMKIANAELHGGAPTIPVISVVFKAAGMDKDDLSRAVSASVVAQLSYDSQSQVDDKTKNGFGENLVNQVSDLSSTHKLGLGTHVLMPMIASSLTVPTQRIADIIAKRILVDGIRQQKTLLDAGISQVDQSLVDDLLTRMGFKRMIDVETYAVDQVLTFQPQGAVSKQDDLDQQILKKKRTASENLVDTKVRIERDIRLMSAFNFADALESFLESQRDQISIVQAVRVAEEALTKLSTYRPRSSKESNPTRKIAKKGIRDKVMPRRLSAKVVSDAFKAIEEDHRKTVEEMWWDEWAKMRPLWGPSYTQAQNLLLELRRVISKFEAELHTEISGLTAELEKSENGVVNYVPTGGLELEDRINEIELVVKEAIRASLAIQALDDDTLFTRLVADGNGWRKAIKQLRQNAPLQMIHESVLEPIRSRVQDAMQPRDQAPGAVKGLAALLKAAVGPNGADLEDTKDLIAKLGNLVPGQILPVGNYQECRVLITYPGERDPDIEAFIRRSVTLDGEFRKIVQEAGENARNTLEFTPTGPGETIRVNINMLGQGLLDNPEVKDVLGRWVAEVGHPMDEDLLWRQRIGFHNVGRIFEEEDRDRVVAAIVRGLASGLVEISKGTVERPSQLRIRPPEGAASGELVDTFIDIEPLEGLSPWPNIVNGFERLILSINQDNDFRADVVTALNVMGAGAVGTNFNTVASVVYDLVELCRVELEKINHDLSNRDQYGADWLRTLEMAHEFWTTTFEGSLDVEIDAARYRSLRLAMRAMPRAH